jgi:hypothetical protein
MYYEPCNHHQFLLFLVYQQRAFTKLLHLLLSTADHFTSLRVLPSPCASSTTENHAIVVPKRVDIKSSDGGQMTETCKGINIYELNHTGRC